MAGSESDARNNGLLFFGGWAAISVVARNAGLMSGQYAVPCLAWNAACAAAGARLIGRDDARSEPHPSSPARIAPSPHRGLAHHPPPTAWSRVVFRSSPSSQRVATLHIAGVSRSLRRRRVQCREHSRHVGHARGADGLTSHSPSTTFFSQNRARTGSFGRPHMPLKKDSPSTRRAHVRTEICSLGHVQEPERKVLGPTGARRRQLLKLARPFGFRAAALRSYHARACASSFATPWPNV